MAQKRASVVALKVEFNGSAKGLDEEEAMLQLFAFTPAVSLQTESTTKYLSSNYDQVVVGDLRLWIGEIGQLKEGLSIEPTLDPKLGWRTRRRVEVTSPPGGDSFYAYSPAQHLFVMWERAALPYSRIQSYVRRARREGAVRLEMRAIEEVHSIADLFELFDSVHRVSIGLRHSQSPGEMSVDDILETIAATHLEESVSAGKGGALNTDELLSNPDLPQSRLISHIEKNSENGRVAIFGTIDEEPRKIASDDPVMRRGIDRPTEKEEWAAAFAAILKSLDG